jgi:hypothetical protein
MVKSDKNSNSRFHIAVVLFLLAIITPFLISITSTRYEQYWAFARSIPSGSEITLNDLKPVGARLEGSKSEYLSTDTNLLGSVINRSFLAGELVDARYLSDSVKSTLEEVSIAIVSSDIPMTTQVGDFVSIYLLQDAQNGEAAFPPIRILSGVFISGLDRRGSNFGNTISLTLRLDQSSVSTLLGASSKGRLVLVGKDG